MKKIISLIAVLSLVFIPVTPAIAASVTWDGGGGNNNWANDNNWVGDTQPVANDSLIFAGTIRTTPNNNTTANRIYDGITFDGTADPFTLSGNAIRLGSAVKNDSTNLQTIDLNMAMNGNRNFNAASGDLTINGVISESGAGARNLNKLGANTLTLTNANTYTGTTNINNGVINIQNSGALGTVDAGTVVDSGAALQIQGGITTLAESLTLNGTGVSSDGALRNISGDNDYAGLVTLGSTSRINSDAGTLTLSNTGTITGDGFTLRVGGSGDTTINSIIGTGSGALAKNGNGTLTLTAANTYTGATNINDGVINIQNGSALGTVDAGTVVDSGAALEIQGDITTLDEALTLNGNGVSNNGALRNISGDNNYAGLVTLGSNSRIQSDAGTLTLSNAGTMTGAGFNLRVEGAGDTVIDSIIGTGAGAFTKAGNGSVTLNSANTYSGGTTLTNGTLNLGNANAIGTGNFTINGGTIDNTSGGALTLATDNTQTWGGDFAFTGTNDLNLGTGAVTLGANRTVTVNGGNLIVGGAIGDGGGNFTLDKNGTGTLTLSGTHTYTGVTNINAGTLAFGGDTTLGGNLALTGGGGTLDLGTYTSTLAGGASFDFTNAADTLRTTLSGSTIGNLTAPTLVGIANGTINLTVTGTPTTGTYNIVTDTAAGGVVNATSLTLAKTGGERFNIALVQGATQNDLQLTVARGAVTFEDLSAGGNAGAVGSTLDQIADSNPTGDMAAVISALDAGTSAQDENSMNSMMPDVSSGALQGSRTLTGQSLTSVSNRLGSVRSGGAASGVSSGDMMSGVGVWIQGLGSHVKQDSRKGIEGYQANTFGTTVGADKIVDNHVRVGLAAGYGFADVDSKTTGSPGTDIDSWQGTVYGSYDSMDLCQEHKEGRYSRTAVRNQGEDLWYVDGMFAFTQNNYDSRREVYLPASTRIAKADHHGQQYSTKFEGGYTFVFEKTKELELTPFASLGYNYLYMNKYKEGGAGALNLTVDGEGFHELLQALGTKLAYPIVCKKAGTFIPSVKAAWLYDYIGDQFETTAKFAGGGPSFNSQGAKPAKNGFLLGAELAFLNKGNMTLTGNWDWEIKNQYDSNTYYGTARFDF